MYSNLAVAYDTQQKNNKPMASRDIYTSLRKEILDLYLCPGAVVSIHELCEYFQAGRSPVRDALMRLEQEALVVMLPQRGVMISLIDMEAEAQERFMRVALEEAVMTEFIHSYTNEQIQELDRLLAVQKEWCSAERRDRRKFLELDNRFHSYFYQATNRQLCLEAQQTMGGHYHRIRLLHCKPSQDEENVEQHEAILEAIKRKDEAAMKAAFRFHLQKLDQEEGQLLELYPYLFKGGMEGLRTGRCMGVDYLQSIINPFFKERF